MAVNFLYDFDFSSIAPDAPITIPCPDQKVGIFNGAAFCFTKRINIDYNTGAKNPPLDPPSMDPANLNEPIVIILESPHKDEYNSSSQPIGPANGKTGKNFERIFATLIKGSIIYPAISKSSHDVVFINAVQYQCSLGQPSNRREKKEILAKCFSGGAQSNDLERRLNALDPFAVINLCTSLLCSQVASIAAKFKNYTCGTHPSSWTAIIY